MTAVTLDLWHTLIYLPPAAEESYLHAQSDLATMTLSEAPVRAGRAALGEEELRQTFVEVYQAAVDASFAGRTIAPGEQFRIAAARAGRDAPASEYLRRLKRVIDEMPFGLADGALEFLEGLRRAGHRVAVISNTVGEPGAYLRPLLTRYGFDRFVEAYLFSDELPWTKPNPVLFRAALDRLDATPDEAVHVGDGWADVEGARAAHLRAAVLFTGLHEYGARYHELFMTHGGGRPSAEYTATTLREVERWIGRLLPAGG